MYYNTFGQNEYVQRPLLCQNVGQTYVTLQWPDVTNQTTTATWGGGNKKKLDMYFEGVETCSPDAVRKYVRWQRVTRMLRWRWRNVVVSHPDEWSVVNVSLTIGRISHTHYETKENKQTKKDTTCLAAVSVPSTSKRHSVLVSTAASPILSELVAVSGNIPIVTVNANSSLFRDGRVRAPTLIQSL